MSSQKGRDLLIETTHAKATPVYRSSRAEYLEYFGGNTRKAAEYGIAHGYFVSARTGKPVKLESAQRSLQAERLAKPGTKATQEQFRALGRTLEPVSYKPKDNRIDISVKLDQKEKGGGTRDRGWYHATFTGVDAYAFVNDPNLPDILRAQPAPYPESVIDLFEGDGDGDADYEAEIVEAA